jgi:hypothetical protein
MMLGQNIGAARSCKVARRERPCNRPADAA